MKASLAVDELNALRTLGITVASSVCGASLVVGVFGETTIGVHLDEVKGAIETAGQIRHVDVESELLVLKIEHLVVGVVGHKIHARANICGVKAMRDELDGECTAGRCNPVRASVIGTIQCAVLSAGYGVGTHRHVPRVTSVAVGGAACCVQRAPVRVDRDRCGQGLAVAACRTLLNAEVGVDFIRLRANLLTTHNGEVDGKQNNHVMHDG